MKASYIVKRILAYVIDILVCFACILLTQWIFVKLGWNPYANQKIIFDRSGLHLWVMFTVTIPIQFYFALLERSGISTPGKIFMRLIVVTRGEKPLSFRRSLLRNVIKLLPWETNHLVLFYFGDLGNGPVKGYEYGYCIVAFITLGYLLCMLASKKSLAPHDMLIRTKVIQRCDISSKL